jgi:hypothetical protein
MLIVLCTLSPLLLVLCMLSMLWQFGLSFFKHAAIPHATL